MSPAIWNWSTITVAGVQAIEPNIDFNAAGLAANNQVAFTANANGYTLNSTSKSDNVYTYTKDETATPTVARTCVGSCNPNW